MEGVDHIDVAQICSRSLVGDIDRMLERQIPDREGFKFRISGLRAAFVFVIELGKAGRQLPAAATRTGHDHQRLRYFDIRVGAVPLLTDDGIDVRRIALGEAVLIGFDISAFQLVDKAVDRRRILVAGHDHAVDLQIVLAEDVDQAQHFQIISDAEVLPRLAVDDVAGIDADDDFRLLLHALQQLDLRVFIKARQYAHRMLVMHQLAAELQIQPFTAARIDSFQNIFGLFLDIFVCIKTYFSHLYFLPARFFCCCFVFIFVLLILVSDS